MTNNTTLESLDIQQNRLVKERDLDAKKTMDKEDTLKNIKKTFKFINKMHNVDCLQVNDWLFNELEFSDKVSDCIKEIKARLEAQEDAIPETQLNTTNNKTRNLHEAGLLGTYDTAAK
jgi:hypothetical protein